MSFESIIKTLGKPYYRTDNVAIYNIDCRDGLDSIVNSKNQIDLTVTSPPYNIGKEYESIAPINEYVSWLTGILNSVSKITKENGSLLLNVGYLKIGEKGKAVPIPYLIWDKIDMFLMQEIVWNYGAGVSSKKMLSPRNEKVLWYIKNQLEYTFNLDAIRDPDVKYPNQKKNGKLRCNTLGKNPSDVWQIAKVTSGANRSSEERMPHPAQFPEDLISRIVLGFSNERDVILDPFLGSGTTLSVCQKLNRQAIGFEISKDYCEVAKNRIKSLISQTSLSLAV
jgi:adenine-specific DNA-methyltransferase